MTVDEFLAHVTPTQKEYFEHLRTLVHSTVPNVEEVMSYGIPTFKYKGKFLIYWGAFKDHMSLYPIPHNDALRSELQEFVAGKGTLRFTEATPVPDKLIKQMILDRQADLDA